MMRNKSLLRCVCALLVGMLLLGTAGCGEPVSTLSNEEARTILAELLPDSQKVLRILWGDELPLEDPDATPVESVTAAQYYPIASDSPYRTEAAVRAYARTVYTEEYCKQLFQMAFEGYQLSYEGPVYSDDETAETVTETHSPRFREENGVLCVDITFDISRYHLGAEVDVSQAEIVWRGVRRVTAEVDYSLEGETGKMRLTLVETADGWRLDSPTY